MAKHFIIAKNRYRPIRSCIFSRPFLKYLVGLGMSVSLMWPQYSIAAYSAHVVEAHTGSILYSYRAHRQNFPASLGKVMTLYLVFRGLDMGDFSLETQIPVSTYAARQPPSKLGLAVGETISIRDSILALTTKSANDIASALAEFMTGTEREFAKAMTQQARLLGMINTVFRNASGLPHSQQKTTALDMTILGRALYTDFPHYCHFFSKRKFTFRGKTYRTHNNLLGVYRGVNGIKTGYIRASGYHLMVSGIHNQHQIIAVVMGGKTARSRDNQMKRLLDRAYSALDRNDQLLRKVIVPTGIPPKPDRHTNSASDKNTEISDTGATAIAAVEKMQTQSASLWAVQLGAFTKERAARLLLDSVTNLYPEELVNAVPRVTPITTEEGILFRAQHIGLTEKSASNLCALLKTQARPCIVLRPEP